MNGQTAYATLKNMSVGDICIFNYSSWGNVRTIASQMKTTFGCKFRVRKLGKRKQQGQIKVIRIE